MKKAHWLGLSAGVLSAMGIALAGIAPAQAQDHRGGTMRIVAVAAAGTLDPQINYTLQYWQLYQSVYDGLVSFKKAAGQEGFKIVPDLAEAIPAPQDDGKTYVFKLRKGIKFSNGKEVTVKDVVASFQRIFKVSSPTTGFYSVIVGGDACLKTPETCTLDGGVVGDEANNTVTFHLTAPDSEFFQKLGLPHASILPADAPAKDAGNDPIPGTGAYMFTAYDPNKELKMERNPDFKEWSKDAQPDGYPDTIVMDFGLTDEAEVTAVENGQADWMFDQPPTDRLAELGTQYADQVHINPLFAMYYTVMNVNIPPFNNEKARQAVNYAMDRGALVKLFGGSQLAQPACQILPPGFPGHVDYCPYTKDPAANKWSAPDMDKAMALMKESGVQGQPVTVIVEDTAIGRDQGTYLQSLLNDLGFKASVKVMSQNVQFTYIQNTNNKVQISVSRWYQDYPAPSDFLNILLGCENFHPGSDSSVNIAGFCDKAIDAKMHEAMKVALTDEDKANQMWAEVDKEMTDKAPMAVMFTPKQVDLVSKRLGNYQFNPQYNWMVSQGWVQ